MFEHRVQVGCFPADQSCGFFYCIVSAQPVSKILAKFCLSPSSRAYEHNNEGKSYPTGHHHQRER